MARDLSFWKISNKADMENHSIYTALSDEVYLNNVAEIPMVQIQNDINEVFKDWENNNNQFYEKGEEAFELMLTKQFARIDSHRMTQGNLNKIIDILAAYDCPLYDSAIDMRFE